MIVLTKNIIVLNNNIIVLNDNMTELNDNIIVPNYNIVVLDNGQLDLRGLADKTARGCCVQTSSYSTIYAIPTLAITVYIITTF